MPQHVKALRGQRSRRSDTVQTDAPVAHLIATPTSQVDSGLVFGTGNRL